MAIKRDVKTLSKRLDRNYFARPSALRRMRVGLILLCCAAALGWWGLAGGATEDELYNPGPVSAVHASIASNCMACHAGEGESGFSKSVTDTACLACHDGAIHHANQKLDAAHNTGALAGKVLAVKDQAHPAGMRSASCIACHTEHRGHAMLAGTHDALCVTCHADVKDSANTAPAIQNRVVAFNATDHPDFGRSLVRELDGAKRLFDPTILQFNHRKHLALADFNSNDSCIKCHEVRDDATTSVPTAQFDGKYVKPISFEKHCLSCHAIEAPGVVNQVKRGPRVTRETLLEETTAPHESMEIVRAYAAAHVNKAIMAKTDATERDELIKKLTEKLAGDIDKAALRDGAWHGEPIKPAADASPVDLYAHAIAINNKGCVLCHSIEAEGGRIKTVPTLIPEQPRRWFAASRFDHRAHRDMSCVDCHATFSQANLARLKDEPRVPQIEQTSYMNSPTMTWTLTTQAGETFQSTTKSCLDCHHSGGAMPKGVASDCVSCHQFHDRAKER